METFMKQNVLLLMSNTEN